MVGRFANSRSKAGLQKFASISKTLKFFWARAIPTFAVRVVFPTPPFPDAMVMVFPKYNTFNSKNTIYIEDIDLHLPYKNGDVENINIEVLKKSKEQLYGKPGLYRLFNQIPNRIKEKYGETLCKNVTSKWQTAWLCREHALYCREIITDAAEIAAELIFSDTDEAAAQPFGTNVENLED